ncbi:MAG: DUF805 domain-containing protein [Alphaproteobacteria bacterium]|nr:DUF805 domain-containing protein [Alphaproteobacteria bacterium]
MLKTEKHYQESLPANLSWRAFFAAAFGSFHFIDIRGRSSRKEWWVVTLSSFVLMFLAAFIYSFLAVYVFDYNYETASLEELNTFINIGQAINFFFSIPMMAVGFRRFHDLGWSAWLSLLIIPNFLLPFWKGENKDNKYGVSIY